MLKYFVSAFLGGSVFFILVACDNQENDKALPVMSKTQEISVLVEPQEKVKLESQEQERQQQQTKPVLDLSIDSISDENKVNNDNIFTDNTRIEKNSALFNTLNKKHTKSGINLSGELLTDKNADDNTSYLKSVDGVQIDIQGSFK